MLSERFQQFLTVPTSDLDQQRRAKMLNILLVGLVILLICSIAITNIGLYLGQYSADTSRISNVVSVIFLVSSVFIYYINHRVSPQLAAILFLTIMTVGLFYGDRPHESIWGRNMIALAIPVFTTSLIYRPVASFYMAGFISLLSLVTAFTLGVLPNVIAVVIYFSLALIAWLTSRSLEQAIADLREANVALDQRVAERTEALDKSIVALQQEIIEREAAERALRTAHDDLEQRVALRTNDLQVANAQLQQEIIERRKTEADLEEHVRALAASNAELEQFAYVASHDLREPLRKVRSFTELLQEKYDGQLDAKADRYIDFIVTGANRMQALIADLLVYSRVGRQAINRTKVDLSKLIAQVESDLSLLILETDAEITTGDLPVITADHSKLLQLFQNLISNSLKFRNPVERPKVHIWVDEHEDAYHISVRDNGIGVPPEYEDRIFLIFQRLHTKDKYPGTGIGLAICKKIALDHGGNIWLKKSPGGGATFTISIPRQSEMIVEVPGEAVPA